MKVSAILKGPKDEIGRQKVYIRIADRFKRRFHPTNLRITKDEFEKGKVKNSHPQAKRMNDAIKQMILRTEGEILFSTTPKEKDFFHYANECLSSWENVKKASTLKQNYSEIHKLRRFTERLRLSDITPEWLQSYSDYCYSKGNQGNTVHKTFKFLRMILRKAHRERLIELYPFDIFKMPKYRDPQKVYLTKEQIHEIEKFTKREHTPEELKFIGTWFLVCCWTGLRFSDAAAFNKNKIKAGRLTIYTQKTHDVVSFPVNDKLKKLFEAVNYKPLHLTNEYCNRMIKIIAEACEITDKISWHTSRHTFGTLAASAGIRQEIIAKLMGHSDLRSTAIYAKLANPVIDAELKKLN